MKTPNFFIIGAPKCGTTSLNNILRSHPQIFVPFSFEPQFFCSDFSEIVDYTLESYLELFSGVESTHLAAGEKSTIYIYSETAVKNILDFNPEARLIVMLRNPVDLVHSWHSQLYFSYMEDIEDFEKAWDMQEERAKGDHIPRHCKLPFSLQYRKIGKLGKYVQKLYATAPSNQIKTILMEDFHANTDAAYTDILNFLKVPYAPMQDQRRLNANRQHRSRWLGSMLAHGTTSKLRTYGRKFINLPGLRKLPIKHTLAQLNKVEVTRKALREEFRAKLEQEFHDDIGHLGETIKRDLSHWQK